MNEAQRRTHVWHIIQERAFSPKKRKDRAKWLHCFHRSVGNFDLCPSVAPKLDIEGFKGAFESQSLEIECRYSIKSERADISLVRQQYKLQYGIERSDFACTPNIAESEKALECITTQDIAVVLRGMIEHPRCHLHIQESQFPHEVRFGVGLDAAFLALFQFRFQLCISEQKRTEEIGRLKSLFTTSKLQTGLDINPPTLFGLGST